RVPGVRVGEVEDVAADTRLEPVSSSAWNDEETVARSRRGLPISVVGVVGGRGAVLGCDRAHVRCRFRYANWQGARSQPPAWAASVEHRSRPATGPAPAADSRT